MKFSRNKLVLGMALLGLTSMVSATVYAKDVDHATLVTPTAGTATIDGNISEWNTGAGSPDFSAKMCTAGSIGADGNCEGSGKVQLSTMYSRYDCNTDTMYVLVLRAGSYWPNKSASDAWVKIYNLSQNPQVDGNSSTFSWIAPNGVQGSTLIGYEASFKLAAGTYNDAQVHLNVDSNTSSTGKNGDTMTITVPVTCTMPASGSTSTTTPTTSGTAGPTSGTVGGYGGFNNWGQCQSTMSGGTTLSVVGRLLPASGVNYNDSSVTGEVYNNSNTPQTVTLVSYKEFYPDTNFDDKTVNGVLVPGQRVNDYQTVTVPAKGHVNLTAQLPGCSTQIDLVCADVIQYLGGGNLYGGRKLAYYHAHQPNNGWCNSTGVTSWNGAFEAAAQAAADQAAADAAAQAAVVAAAQAAADKAAADAAAKAAADAAAKAAADKAAADVAAKAAADKAAADAAAQAAADTAAKVAKDAKAAKDAADAEAKKQADEAAAAKVAKDAADAEAKKQADEAAAAKVAKDAADAEAQKQADEAAAAAKVASDAAEANAKKQADEAAVAAKAAEDAKAAAEAAAKVAEEAKAADQKRADEAAAAAKADEEAKAAEAKKQADESASATKTAEDAKVGENAADKTAKEVANNSNENSANDSANAGDNADAGDANCTATTGANAPTSTTVSWDDDKGTNSYGFAVSREGNTWTYQVNRTGGKDLSHWTLIAPSCVTHVGDATNGVEIGQDGSIKDRDVSGIKWNSEGGTFSFTLDGDYSADALEVLAKAGSLNDGGYATSTIMGPNCSMPASNQCPPKVPEVPVAITGAFYESDESICSFIPKAVQDKNGNDVKGWTLPQWIVVNGYIEATNGSEPAADLTLALVGNDTVKICPAGVMAGSCHENDASDVQPMVTDEDGKIDFAALVYWPGVPSADRDNGAVNSSYSVGVMGGTEGTEVLGGLSKKLLWNHGMMNNKGCTITLKQRHNK